MSRHPDDYRDIERSYPARHLLSPKGLSHIKTYEGFRAEVYDDLHPNRAIGPDHVFQGTPTIGYGHTGEWAQVGITLTEDDAAELLLTELKEFEDAVSRMIDVPVSQGQYDALVGFVYNVGSGNFGRSTLLRRLNAGDHDGAAAEFGRWIYSKGQRLEGLERRREAERAMFLGIRSAAFMGLGDMAEYAEEMLGVGAAQKPDAVVERGVTKSLAKSKTIWAAAGSIVAAVMPSVAGLDQRVQLVAVVLLGAYMIFNRWLEHQAGEH